MTPFFKFNRNKPVESSARHIHLTDGEKIHQFICQKIESANKSIFISMAYFNDAEIFELLRKKSQSHEIAIKLLLAENSHNTQLDFSLINQNNSKVKIYRTNGYGQLHTKSIIIDEVEFLTGSYNLTNNARKNNVESLTATNDTSITQKAIEEFNNNFNSPNAFDLVPNAPISDSNAHLDEKEKAAKNAHEKFTRIFETIVSGTVRTNEETLENIERSGFEKCEQNSGDVTTLPAMLDEILQDAKTEIDFQVPEKQLLIDQIENLKQNIIDDDLEPKKKEVLQKIESEYESNVSKKQQEITSISGEKEALKNEISEITKSKNVLEKSKRELEIEIERLANPRKHWFEYLKPIALFILTLALLFFVINFYASANTILLYLIPEIEAGNSEFGNRLAWFLPDWYDYASKYGKPYIVLIMTLIPLIFSNSNIIFPKLKLLFKGIGIVIIDLFVGFKVTHALIGAKDLINDTTTDFTILTALSKTDFWLIFIFGGLGLLALSVLIEKIISFINHTINNHNGKLLAELKTKNHHLDMDINQLLKDINLNSESIQSKSTQIEDLKNDLISLENAKSNNYQKIINEFDSLIDEIKFHSQKFQTDIRLDVPLVTNTIIQQRIAKFRIGLDKRLFEHFHPTVAAGLATKYEMTFNQWYKEKFKN